MVIRADSLLDMLETAMNTCCSQYAACEGCQYITACINLWARACEKSFTKPLSPQQLQNYIKEFNQFMKNRSKDCQITKHI